MHDPLGQGSLIFAGEVQDADEVDLTGHAVVPALAVVLVAREAVDEELGAGPSLRLHSLLKQADSNGDWHDFAFVDDSLDHCAVG